MIQRAVAIVGAKGMSQGKVCQCEQPRASVSPTIVLAKMAESTGNDADGIVNFGGRLGVWLMSLIRIGTFGTAEHDFLGRVRGKPEDSAIPGFLRS